MDAEGLIAVVQAAGRGANIMAAAVAAAGAAILCMAHIITKRKDITQAADKQAEDSAHDGVFLVN
ncbi:hypothetical protein [Jeotgalibacillus sp. R-1-5s-1]|uniref:hypothetical protein n=1 Tax=Jeotgalibacillus sp. R-1-5s-1 TaxID=2555897 RepID=UPI001069384D|nr:hypothetical protein [Jeotgalibacillus sp. R-1-5s-1]TFD99535.1 hypothetical protein E2491_07425 [Jeotgalibacillus sp. R-1-5s-1]